MLSRPPCSLAKSTSACASVGGRDVVEPRRGVVQQAAQVLGLGAVVPQAVGADHEPARRRRHRRQVRREVVGSVPPSQRVIECACGPVSASSRGTPAAICSWANESSRPSWRAGLVGGVGQPVDAAVADVAGDDDVVLDDRGREGARRRVGDVLDDGGGRRPRWPGRRRSSAPARRRPPTRPGCRRPWGRAGRARPARPWRRRATAMCESVAIETPSQTTRTAREPGRLGGTERHGVLVAGVPPADVADAADPGRR